MDKNKKNENESRAPIKKKTNHVTKKIIMCLFNYSLVAPRFHRKKYFRPKLNLG
jgi:hypothetical protein